MGVVGTNIMMEHVLGTQEHVVARIPQDTPGHPRNMLWV